MTLRRHINGIEIGNIIPLGSSAAIRSPLHRITHRRPAGRMFTIIRHPAAWLRSFWLDQSPQRIGLERFLHQFWSDDLDQFVANVCTNQPGYVGKLYRASMPFHSIKIFRLEDGLAKPLQWLKVQHKKITPINVSPPGPCLSENSRKMVAEAEASIIEQYGYEDINRC